MTSRFPQSPSSAILVVATTLVIISPLRAVDVFQQNARLGRGANLLGWDPVWRSRERGQIRDAHFKMVREAGFQHVRINLHPLRDGRPDAVGRLREEFFAIMDWAVDQALANQLLVVLDFHDDLAISTDPEGKRKEFLAAWRAITEHCQSRPDKVLFETLNEPTPRFTHESWHEYCQAALGVIRRSNPDRTVIIGPAMWNGVGELEHLKLPPDDRNILATVEQIARNISGEGGFLTGKKYLIHDRDSLYTNKFDSILKAAGVEAVKLPPRSPNLNPRAERFVRSV